MLDIGANLGALIIYTDADMSGAEIEISPTGHDHQRAHKEILERPVTGRAQPTPPSSTDWQQGSYTLWIDDRPHATEPSRSKAAASPNSTGQASRP